MGKRESFHPFMARCARAERADREAAARYRGLAALADDESTRADMAQRAVDSEASAARWADDQNRRLQGRA